MPPHAHVSAPAQPARGYAVPFTGALLCGARVRRATHPRLEFLLPNREGTRGFPLLGWASLRETHAPTLHDIRLVQFLERLPQITPATIQSAALLTAAEGLAGEAAAVLAHRRNVLERNRLARRVVLLRRLAARSGDAAWAAGALPAAVGSPAAIAWEAAGVHRVARLSGLPQDAVARALDDLSRVFTSVNHAGGSRPVRMITLLRECQRDWARHVAGAAPAARNAPSAAPGHDPAARLAAACERLSVLAAHALDIAARQFALNEAACEDVGLLFDLWRSDPAAPAVLAAPLTLALDGWERICLLWCGCLGAPGDDPADAIALLAVELAVMAALLPVEAAAAAAAVVIAAPGHPADDPAPGSWFGDGMRGREARLPAAGPLRGEALARCIARNERARLAELELDMADDAPDAGEDP